MTRLRALFLLAPVTALAVLSGCGGASPAAATIAGHDISRHELNLDLDAISKNKALRNNPQLQIASTPKGTLNSSITASWLAGLVRQVVIDREFTRRHLSVTAADRASARTNLEQQQFGPAIFNGFSKGFRDRVVEREARIEALARAFTGGVQSQAELTKAGQQFALLLETGLRRGHVHVDPRYGKPQFTPQGFQIAPPVAPTVRETPSSTTTAPSAQIPGATPGG
jgi:hypothetical protein